jgi:hypothetical protein
MPRPLQAAALAAALVVATLDLAVPCHPDRSERSERSGGTCISLA